MSKEIVNVKYCILGYGYASLIAYHKILKNNNHDDVLILQNKERRQIFTLEYEELQFSPLPIFPVKESELYNSDLFADVSKQKPISVSFSDLVNFDYPSFETKKDSLADFMVKAQGIDKNLCLGAKQWGEQMFSTAFSQVQSKIKRHYISPKGNTRIGYINGKSLFSDAVSKLKPNIFEHSGLVHIAIGNREIHLKERVVRFEKLVSTIPLHLLLQLCGLPFEFNTASAGAYFCFFKYDTGFDANQMVYDCDYKSDIIRVFSIDDGFLLAQLNSDKYGKVQIPNIKSRIQVLAPEIQGLEFAKDLNMPMCYPLDLVTDEITKSSLDRLRENEITPFGRFGNWEYSDLHELDWSGFD